MVGSLPSFQPSASTLLLPRVDATKALALTPFKRGILEFIGITRLVDGKETDMFVAACPEHNYYYKGKPPLTSGCRSCWEAYFISEWAIAGAKKEDVDKLEEVIRHATEAEDKGTFDFKPQFDFKVEHEN